MAQETPAPDKQDGTLKEPQDGRIENHPNLRPFSRSDRERTVEMARRGGIASGIARRERKTMREAAIEVLHTPIGDDGDTIGKNIVLAMALEAKRGNVAAARFLAELTGDLGMDPSQLHPDDLPPPVQIGIHDPDFIARERKRQEELRTVDVEAVVVNDAKKPPLPAETDQKEGEKPSDVQENGSSSAETDKPEQQKASLDSPSRGLQGAPETGNGREPVLDAQEPQEAPTPPPAPEPKPETKPEPAKPATLPPPRTPSEARKRMRAEMAARGEKPEKQRPPTPQFSKFGFSRHR